MKKSAPGPLDNICPWCFGDFTADGDMKPWSLKDAVETHQLDDVRTWTRADERQRNEGLKACRKCMIEYINKKRKEIEELDREDRIVARVRGETIKIALGLFVAIALVIAMRGCL
jgi:hypothetical protein